VLWLSRRRLRCIAQCITRMKLVLQEEAALGLPLLVSELISGAPNYNDSQEGARLSCGGRLFSQHDALDVMGSASGSVAVDEGGAHLGIALGGLELARHAGEKAGQDQFFFYADD
jgi:hypothetical protein